MRHFKSSTIISRLFILGFLVIAFSNSSNSQVIYDVPGTYTWIVPPCVTSVTVEAWGAGGGGGGTIGIVRTAGNDGFSDSEVCVGAGGGAGGGYTSRTFPVIPGQSYNVVVGAGGTAGPAGAGTWNGGISTPAGPGGTGGTSSFTGNGINLQATGGSGGGPASGYHNTSAGTCIRVDGTAGLTPGTGSGGTVNFTGGTGAVGYILSHSTDKSGGGGGAAGPGGNGGNAPHPNTVGVAIPPAGIGNAPGGNGGTGRMTNVPGTLASNGVNGSVRGGGGGGSLIHRTPYNVSVASGGIGGRGEVRINYTAAALSEPLFSSVAPICSGAPLSPLPTTSNNGFNGTWSPALNNSATTTYVFTPDPSGPCADTASLRIVVNPATTPTFTAVAPICTGGTLAPLPTTSNNGFTGTWSPALDNTTTTLYTFTPTAGQCATSTTMTITVGSPVTPTFTAVAPICSGDPLSPLPTTSNNGFTGTWSPAINNTTTTLYTFTPTAGQCATSATMTITVGSTATVPTFTAVPSICSGDPLAALPTTSNNSINGTWSPAINNTATTLYTFTPTAGQCATTTTMTITVVSPTTPTFNVVAPICNGDPLSPLPTTSNNGINGTWSPALNNTLTTLYTFTPTAGQCATTATMTISVGPPATPTFTAVAPICNGNPLAALPTTSNNGFTGTWSPAINNTTTTLYTFTPTAGQCATTTTLTITVNSLPVVDAGNYTSVCRDAAAIPLVGSPVGGTFSGTGVTGNNFSPAQGTQTVTYTYTDGNGCTNSDNSIITIFNLPNINAGNDIDICEGESVTLSGTGGVTYVWNNGGVNGQAFTPTAGQTTYTVVGTDANGCVNTDNITVTVTEMPYAEVVPDITTGLPALNVNFQNNSSVTTNYLWDFGNGSTIATTTLISTSSTYNNPGTYIVILSATNGVCTDYDTVQIIIINNEPTVEVPNVFTPNGDASNNHFFIDTEYTSNIKYIIVNRWGNLIFEADGINPLWDGTSNGKPVEEGVYFYKYEVLGINGEIYTGHGNVTLIRN